MKSGVSVLINAVRLFDSLNGTARFFDVSNLTRENTMVHFAVKQ